MNRDEQFSEEQINAFVDDELDPEEKSRIYTEASRNADLDHRLCKQRKVKELVKFAYEDIPSAKRKGPTSLGCGGFWGRALAASLLIAVGLVFGFLGRPAVESGVEQVAVVAEPHKYLLHVASGAPDDMAAALERAEYLLASSPDDAMRQVEIVANEQGINLLRSDITQFATEISVLQSNDVVFYACSKTIQRLEDDGIEVHLVPHTVVEYTALDRVVSRMQEGWQYEKI
jgi:intracellular sulfur oxidation DsrE/DsrF family protein